MAQVFQLEVAMVQRERSRMRLLEERLLRRFKGQLLVLKPLVNQPAFGDLRMSKHPECNV